jgi:hypothetical protein
MALALVLLSFGVLLLLYLWYESAEALASRQWPLTTGVIIRSEVRIEEKNAGPDSFYPDIEYSYLVKGSEFSSTRLRHGSWAATRNEAESFVERFPVGATVDVRFSPHAPDRSVLIPGISWGDRVLPLLFVAGFLIAPGLFMAVQQARFWWDFFIQ